MTREPRLNAEEQEKKREIEQKLDEKLRGLSGITQGERIREFFSRGEKG